MPRSKYVAFKKLTLIEEFKRSGISKATFSRGYDIDRNTFNHWLNRYERDGIDGLREARHNNHYPKALKLEAVVTYLSGRYSLNEVALKFGLRSKKQLRDWVSKYNKDKTVTASPSKRQVPIMSRKTTFEERISIVEYVTKDKHSYTETAEHFGVSYQQARSWVLKAQQGGYETLVDNRG
ncbi:helix-turn-helix domain-containing protein, partial [Latilactobacillus graminis]